MVGPSHRALNTRIPRVRGGEGKGWGGLKFTRISIHDKQAIAIRPLFAATLSEQISVARAGEEWGGGMKRLLLASHLVTTRNPRRR